MSGAVIDTHALIWYLQKDTRLSAKAFQAIETCRLDGIRIWVPGICIVEMTYLCEKNRIPNGILAEARKAIAATDSVLQIAPLDNAVLDALVFVPRSSVPDMPDRIIAATAFAAKLPLISRDAKIQMSAIATIW